MIHTNSERLAILTVILFSICFLGVVKAALEEEYVFILKWGRLGSGDGQLYYPRNVAIDDEGYVYVADTDNDRVQKFNSSGGFITKWGGYGSADGQFIYPMDIVVDGEGHIYVVDMSNYRVQKFNSSGDFITKWGSYGSGNGQFRLPLGVAVDDLGNVYVTDQENHHVQKFTSDGVFLLKWGSQGSDDGQFNHPRGVAVDEQGDVYVVDQFNYRVQKFTNEGDFIAKWGSYGSGNGQFDLPVNIDVDLCGDVYIADAMNYRVQKFNSSGGFITKWGSYGSGNGQFNLPMGVVVDYEGYVYVADTDNNRIQKFARIIVGRHDVAITSIRAWPTTVPRGQLISINVTVENRGDSAEIFDLIVHADQWGTNAHFDIGNETVSLDIGEFELLEFVWNTTDVPCGTYWITAEANLAEDADPADNIARTKIGGICVPFNPSPVNIFGLLMPIAFVILALVLVGVAILGLFKLLMSVTLRYPSRSLKTNMHAIIDLPFFETIS